MSPDNPEPKPVLEPLSLGDILDRAVRFYKTHFLKMIGIAAVPSLCLLPLIAGQALMVGSLRAVATTDTLPPSLRLWAVVGGFVFVYSLVYGYIAMVGIGAGIKMVGERYLGNALTVGAAYRDTFRRSPGLVWTSLITGLLVGIGFLMCLIPGIIGLVMWTFVVHAYLFDGQTGFEAMRRSARLAEGEYGRIILLGLFVLIMYVIVMTVFHYVPLWIYLGARIATSNGNPLGALESMSSLFLLELSSLAAQTLAAPIGPIALTMLYFDIRVRKEGFDLERMAQLAGYGESPV